MVGGSHAELSFGGRTIALESAVPSRSGLYVSDGGIDGWHSTPEAKVSITERKAGDGAFSAPEESIIYAARVVTLHWHAIGESRDGAVSGVRALLSCAHRLVRLRVVDGGTDTFADGYAEVSTKGGVASRAISGTLTLTCPDPRRLSTAEGVAYLYPTSSGTTGGLSFGDAALGLAYPLSFGQAATEARNYGTVSNNGTSRAYPVITVNGPFDGVRVDLSNGEAVSTIEWAGHVGGVPLVLDCRERRAAVAGLDVSQHLTSRGFATVAPGGSLSCSLQSSGTGWAEVSVRDTYI